ncbi:MAG: hypothetical protein NTAFB05_24220 [Nitrobacter sp.]
MVATSFGGTGWLALALLASEASSVLQPARRAPDASTANVMIARPGVRWIKAERWIKAKLRKRRASLHPKFMASVPQAIE